MKKKSLLLMLLMALLVPWAAKAQQTAVLNEGTNTGYYVPFYGNNADYGAKGQFIIPATDLAAKGITSGCTISKITLHSNATQTGTYFGTSAVVEVGEVSYTTFSETAFVTEGLTSVLPSGINTLTRNANGTVEIAFGSNYTYNGGNLLISIGGYGSNYKSTTWLGVSGDDVVGVYAYQNYSTSGSIPTTATGTQNFSPKVTITYISLDPYISLSPNSTTVFTGFTQNLTASYGNVSGTPTITYSSSNNKIASVSGSGTTATVTGVSAGTATITATMVYNATEYTATCAVTVEEPSYCTPSFSDPSDDHITNFTTTGGETNINNSSTYVSGGYSDYYATVSASIQAGNTLTCTVTPSTTSYSYGHSIWVDWNRNYEFENDERVAYSTSTAVGDWTGEFEVPSTTAAGDYRLRVIHLYNNNVTNPCHSASYGEGEDYKLTVTAANPYQKPVNLQVSNLTAATATITWEAPNSDVQSYKYQYREAGGSWSAPTSTTALSAPLTVLTGNTTYEFQVQAIYAGDNESNFASTSFTTPCAAFPIDYEYGFEDENEFNCWEIANDQGRMHLYSNDDVNDAFGSTGIQYSRTGDNLFFFTYYDYPTTNPEYQTIISPELTGITNGLHVEFYYTTAGSYGPETFAVGYSTTNKQLSSFTWGNEVTSGETDYQLFKANYPAGTKYIAFQQRSDDKNWIMIDDFSFTEAPDCVGPSNIQTPNITTTGANLSWTVGGSESAWDIYVTDDVTDVPDDLTTPTYASVTYHTNYPISGLTSGTTYYVYLRSACDKTTHSDWTMPYQFNTECETIPLPYSYDFEDNTLPICYNTLSSDAGWNIFTISDAAPQHGSKHLAMLCQSSGETQYLVLPEVDANYPLNEYEITFYAKLEAGSGRTLAVGIMTDPDDESTFEQIGDEITPTTTYAQYKVKFNNYTGSGQYIAILHYISSTGNTFIDNIEVNHLPACIEPDDFEVTVPTAHGATFAWTSNGSETEWHLYVSTENNAPADDINLKEVIVADNNPFTVTSGLNPENTYYAWVRANCGSTDGYSTWVGPETFTTEPACFVPTGLTASEVTGHTAKLSWTGTSDSYNVRYRTAAYVIGETTDFSDGLPTGWTNGSGALNTTEGTATISSGNYWTFATNCGVFDKHAYFNMYNSHNYWLITPSITLGTNDSFSFDVAYTKYKTDGSNVDPVTGGPHKLYVLISTDNKAHWTVLREWNNTTSSYVLDNIPKTGQTVNIDLSAYTGQDVYMAILGVSSGTDYDNNIHIDNIAVGTPVAAGAWQNKTADASPYTATGLDTETKYEAQVQGNCGGEGLSQWSSSVFFTTDIACPAPTALTPSNPTSVSFDLSWNNGGASDWIVAYKKTTETDFTEISLNISDVTEEAGVISYTLGGLEAETDYIVKVRDNCEASYAGDGVSEWTDEVTYSTIAACSALNPVVSNITHHTAKVDWGGESTSGYTVKYRESALVSTENPVFYEAFNTNSQTPPTGWSRYSGLVDAVIAGTATLTNYTYCWYTNNTYALGSYNAQLNIYGTGVKYWLVTPEVVLTNGLSLSFDLALTDYGNGNVIEYPEQQPDDRFVVLVFADDAWHILREWNNTGSPYVYNTIATTGENVVLDLAAYAGKTIKVAFYGESTVAGVPSGADDNDLHIDNVLIGTTIPAGDWQTQAAATTTANLSGLTAGTMYDVKIVPNCDPTQESGIVSFSTLKSDTKYFLTEGEWETAANWMDGEIPTSTDDAIIRANVTITNYAEAKDVTFEGTPTPEILIENGAQFVHNNEVIASYQKLVYGYGDPSNPGGWNFIASPVNSFSTSNMPAGPYDLYKYDEPAASWYSNTGEHPFTSLTRGIGYLYANQQNVTWNFTGSMIGTNTEVTKTLSWAYNHITDPDGVKGFNLMGNPYTRNLEYGDVTIGDEAMTAFLRLDNGDDYESCNMYDGDEILPGQGFFYQVDAAGKSMKFKKATAKDANEIGLISIVAGNDSKVDKAFVQIGGGNTLRKIAFSNSKSSVYVINDGDDYAAATIYELAGTMPVHFKAVAEGEYDITVNTKNIEASTLLLFDNFKNETIDLLETPTYSFKSSADDPENRFKLIFDFNNNNYNGVEDNFTSEIFVYQSGDELIVNGEGELQIFDVLGRLVTSKNISGIERVSKPAQTGVYIFRLNEHTQKLIIK